MKNKNIKNHKNTQKGIALFISLILVSVLMLISFAIANIAFKELIISSSGRESQIAFYASNTGIECALYYDLQDEDLNFNTDLGSQGQEIDCGEGDFPITTTQPAGNIYEHTFWFSVGGSISPCGEVRVTKEEDGGVISTKIESRGYNFCRTAGLDLEPDTDHPRVLERGLRVTYGSDEDLGEE